MPTPEIRGYLYISNYGVLLNYPSEVVLVKGESGLRGQSAMEYLMTYGWALLVIVVVIAVLAWIMTLNRLDQCIFDPGFQCSGHRLVAAYTSPTEGAMNNVMFADVLNGQRGAVNIIGIACVAGNPRPPANWWLSSYGNRFNFNTTVEATDTVNIGVVNTTQTGFTPSPKATRCFKDFAGNPLSTQANSDFSGSIFIAYKFIDENPAIPPKVTSAKVTTRSQ